MLPNLMTAQLAEFTLPQRHVTDRNGPVRWIWSHATRHWWIIIMILVGAIGNAGLAAVVPMLTGQAFDDMLARPPRTELLLPLALIMGGSQILRGILQLGRNFGSELMAQRMERDIRDELYVTLLGKSMTFHNIQPVGDTMARATNDVREVNFMFSPGVSLVTGSLFFLVMPFVFAPRYHPALLLTPALFTLAYFFALWQYLHSLSPVTDAVRSAFGKMNSRLSEVLDGVETVKGAAQEEAEVGRFDTNARRFRDAYVRQGDLEAHFLPMLLFGIALAGGLLHALLLFRQGLLNTGGVVAYFGLLLMLDFPTFASSFAYTQLSLGISSARRILELMNRETNLDQNEIGFTGEMKGQVEFRNVSFAYEGIGDKGQGNPPSPAPLLPFSLSPEPVLQNISFTVKPGQTIAIVGQTGAGKTSLVKLVNRTYDATHGQVLVDGVDVRDWNLAALRQQISIIEQDVFLFSRSISENIRFGKPEATQEEIISAANAAQAEEFVETFEKKYETVIGERGVTLSGGQRQRLALGRAFLTDPRILVLDDSTSSIDSATEDRIQRAIAAAAKGRTTFII
ncbi:MAG: ABC transporter ATP-binding protein/permease, partial [Chloroflexi bacterium]|nr:ABC transporter ATP-binding protein/permease [Chloroflexota bacterium]